MIETEKDSLDINVIIDEQPLAYRILTSIIKRDSISPAYLFAGTNGLGKMTMARWFVKALFCEETPQDSACGECMTCVQVEETTHPDMHLITSEQGSESISIDKVRDEIRPTVKRRTYQGGAKVIVIPKADSMTPQAQNAMLKTLEDPQGDSVLILLSSRPDSLLSTVRSRCVRIPFKDLSLDSFNRRMEKIGIEDDKTQKNLYMTTAADVQLAERLINQEGADRDKMRRITNLLIERRLPPPTLYRWAENLASDRSEAKRNLTALVAMLRQKLVEARCWIVFSECVDAICSAIQALDANANVRLTLEVCLIKLQHSIHRQYN